LFQPTKEGIWTARIATEGITLVPVAGKLNSDVGYRGKNNKNCKFGFQKGHRTSDVIFVLNSLLEKTKWKCK